MPADHTVRNFWWFSDFFRNDDQPAYLARCFRDQTGALIFRWTDFNAGPMIFCTHHTAGGGGFSKLEQRLNGRMKWRMSAPEKCLPTLDRMKSEESTPHTKVLFISI